MPGWVAYDRFLATKVLPTGRKELRLRKMMAFLKLIPNPEGNISLSPNGNWFVNGFDGKDEELIFDVPVSEPELWTVVRPFLYKVVATLLNDQGFAVDDFVVTTGKRTVIQEGVTKTGQVLRIILNQIKRQDKFIGCQPHIGLFMSFYRCKLWLNDMHMYLNKYTYVRWE